MKRLVVFISVCCWVLLMQASIHNVKDYGARADGVTIVPSLRLPVKVVEPYISLPENMPAIPYGLPAMFIFIWNRVHASLRHRLLRRVDMMRLSRTNITVIRTLVIAIGKTP